VTDFTQLHSKLVFSLNNRFVELMSKDRNSMHQVPEIKSIASITSLLVRCVMIFVFLAAAGAGCDHQSNSNRSAAAQPAEQTNEVRILRRGLPGEPRTLDPQLADDDFSFQVVRDLYEGLTAENSFGQIIPGAASSWTVDETGTIYTFHLRPDAKWSNGDTIVAAEFVQGLRRAVDPKTASGSAALLAVIRGASEIIAGRKEIARLGVSAIDNFSVRIELEYPAPFLLQILSQPIAAPVHANQGPKLPSGQSKYDAAIYNGAYVLVSRVPGSFIELARNPNYWNSSHVSIQRVRYINAESESTELREYLAGQLDMTFTIPMPDLSHVLKEHGAEVQMAPTLGTVYLALNLSKAPLKNSPELRQALSMAIDRELISEHVMMGVTPAYTLVADGTSGYHSPKYDWSKWSRDRQLAFARSLLNRSGYSERNPLHLKLYFNSNEAIRRTMIAIAGSWKQNLGVISELTSDEFRVFLAGRKDRSRWDVARLGWVADYDDPSSFLEILSLGNSQNDPEYSSASFNELILQSRVEPQTDKRIILLQSAEQVLLNDYPVIPLYFYRGLRLVKPYVGGAEITPMNRTYCKNLFWRQAS
jgi:oligopeptide transport system substrate-binding protein